MIGVPGVASLRGFIALIAIATLGCARGARVRADLRGRQSAWNVRLDSLHKRESSLTSRVAALPTGEQAIDPPSKAARGALRAMISGTNQMVFDLGEDIRRSVREVEVLCNRDDDHAEQSLDTTATRIAHEFELTESGLANAEQGLLRLGQLRSEAQVGSSDPAD